MTVLGAVLAPLAARYGHWLGMDRAQVLLDRDEAAADIRSMPLILRMERTTPPVWSAALAAAATAATAVCLDPQAAPGGQWHEAISQYCAAHIRKVTRRARAGHWAVVGDLPGLTVSAGTTQVRALVPGLIQELDQRVSRLQVGGTDVAADIEIGGGAGVPTSLYGSGAPALLMWMPPTVMMTAGKAMAQTGHAGMITAALLSGSDQDALVRWRDGGLAAVVRRATPDRWANLSADIIDPEKAWCTGLVAVRDAGFTEIAPGTITIIADASALT